MFVLAVMACEPASLEASTPAPLLVIRPPPEIGTVMEVLVGLTTLRMAPISTETLVVCPRLPPAGVLSRKRMAWSVRSSVR